MCLIFVNIYIYLKIYISKDLFKYLYIYTFMNTYFLLLSLLLYSHKILPFFKQNSKFHHHGVKKPFCAAPLRPPRLALEFCPMASLENTWISSSVLYSKQVLFGPGTCGHVWALIAGKLYRALWRTCGMFRTSRWWFTSGTSLPERKGCIEARWSRAFRLEVSSVEIDAFLVDQSHCGKLKFTCLVSFICSPHEPKR